MGVCLRRRNHRIVFFKLIVKVALSFASLIYDLLRWSRLRKRNDRVCKPIDDMFISNDSQMCRFVIASDRFKASIVRIKLKVNHCMISWMMGACAAHTHTYIHKHALNNQRVLVFFLLKPNKKVEI